MVKFREVAALGATAGIITLGIAVAQARDAGPPKRAEAPAATVAEKAETGQAAAQQIVEIPNCARKVKVVYAGYGESARAGCPAAAN